MALMGAFFWAIRGTTGYGGLQGGLLAGLGWAVLWYGFSLMGGAARFRPYGSARMIAAITFGVALGGMTGYGVYIAWVQGQFYLDYPDGAREIGMWTGFAMLFVCGLHWGGNAGAFMAWCAPKTPPGLIGWLARIAAGVAGAVLAGWLVRAFPHWFLPFYAEGIYEVEEYATCRRAVGSIRNIAPHVGLFLGFLSFEAIRRDWRAVSVMLIMGLGFAIFFTAGGAWHWLHGSALRVDWWKNWEMTIGLGGGLAFGLVFYLYNRPSLAQAKPVTVKERIWGAGVTLWLGTTLALINAYNGFVQLNQLEWAEYVGRWPELVVLIPTTAALAIHIARAFTRNGETMPVSMRTCAIISVLIIIAGYIVSAPIPMQLANWVLVTLYTLYIGVSLALLRSLWTRTAETAADLG